MKISRRTSKVSKDEAWREFAARRGGEVITDGKGRVERLRFRHREWVIVVDTHVVSTGSTSATYTRLRALFEPGIPFRFRIWRRTFFTRFGKLLGMQDVHTGRIVLDRDFVVQTDNESMIRSLLMDSRVGGRLELQPAGTFRIAKFRGKRKPRPANAKELRYETNGVVTDTARLEVLVELFRSTLDSLRALGAAAAAAVPYEL